MFPFQVGSVVCLKSDLEVKMTVKAISADGRYISCEWFSNGVGQTGQFDARELELVPDAPSPVKP